MKDSEFIELLNLYLDHEISATDAARLESEVLANPARRRAYRDYCRMQKACRMLAKDFAEEGVPAMPSNVVAFAAARPNRAGWVAAGAFAAAAACVALVLVTGGREPAAAPSAPIVTTGENANGVLRDVKISAPTVTDRTLPSTVSVPEGRNEPRAGLVMAISLAGDRQPEATPLVSTTEQSAPHFAWINSVQLAPMQRISIDEFRFDGRTPLRTEARPYQKRLPGQAATEWNAIQWQK